jgi:hypothetical protein
MSLFLCRFCHVVSNVAHAEYCPNCGSIGDAVRGMPLTLIHGDPLAALEELCYQFGRRGDDGTIGTGGLSALEAAFKVLGWPDPYTPPKAEKAE